MTVSDARIIASAAALSAAGACAIGVLVCTTLSALLDKNEDTR